MTKSEPEAPGGPARHGTSSVLRSKNVPRLFYAGATSTAGFAVGQVTLTWLVWINTSSSIDVVYIGVSLIAAAVIFSLAACAGLFVFSPYLRNLGWRSPDAPEAE